MEKTGRNATPSEMQQCKDDADKIVDAMGAAMPGATIERVFGALGLVTTSSFVIGIAPEYRLRAFDEYAATIRGNLERGLADPPEGVH